MRLGEEKRNIVSFIDQTKEDKTLELEMRVKKQINQDMFNNIVKRVKGLPFVSLNTVSEHLDIFYNYKENNKSNIRVTVNSIESIKAYCKTNDISKINNVTFLKKQLTSKGSNKNYPIDINNYNIRFNLKKEIEVDKNSLDVKELTKNWKTYLKEFRYKKRISYTTNDGLFNFDLTILRTSRKEKSFGKKRKLQKQFVRENQKKYVIAPTYVKNFNEWYNNLDDSDYVELQGRIIYNYVPTRTLQESNCLKNPFEYEVEIEYLGNKFNYDGSSEEILEKFILNTGIILQTIQNSYYLISEQEKQNVINEYKMLMGSHEFKGPHNVTLELKHIMNKKYEDYKNVVNIRRDYCVTDKADGERNLLIVLEDGSLYLMNRKNTIKSLGAKVPKLSQSILDGEYIKKDKNGNNINLYMVFDVYFINNEDVRSRKFNNVDESDSTKTRNDILKEIFTDFTIEKEESNTLNIYKKKFFYGNFSDYDPKVNQQITELEAQLSLLEPDGAHYLTILSNINTLKQDMKIFEESKKVYQKEYIYHIDGLIYTPIFLGVGEDASQNKKQFNGRWNMSFKWKPPEENTIDFLVQIKQDNGSDVIEYVNIDGEFIAYKTLILSVGYNPAIHTKHNSCRVLNEKVMFEESYQYVPFIPTNPYRKDTQFAYIKLDVNNTMKTLDNSIITNNCILECKYDVDKTEGFRWIPMRIRDTNNPNDFITAKNVWNTIHYPITTEMIKTGVVPNDESLDEVYYSKNIKRKMIKTKPLNDFHSFVKKSLIKKNSYPTNNLIDISCGRAGDINHWIDAQLNYIVGIDVNRENLEHIENGACNRILNNYDKTQRMIDNILFIWGDSSKKFKDGSAAKDDLNKYYLDILHGNIDSETISNKKLKDFYKLGNNNFDIVSCQFSIHYFFKDLETLQGLLENVSSLLKPGGVFIGTSLDGKSVFDILNKNQAVMEHEEDTLLWKINKKYKESQFNDDETCLGYSIDVYMESIGKTFTEYLVNYTYFESLLQQYNLKLKELYSFTDVYVELNKSEEVYGEALYMSDKLKSYSFLNKCFVIEKI